MSDAGAWETWIARHVLHDLRMGTLPEGLTPARFSWNPTIAALRAIVAPEDHELATRLIARQETLMWGAFLARAFVSDLGMTDALVDAFKSETDLDRQIGLLHHLTARPLSGDQYEMLRDWLKNNSASFLVEQRAAFGDPDGPTRLRDRLQSERPEWTIKRWLYMYSALVLDPVEARSVLSANLGSSDPRVAEAASHALTLIAES